MTTRSGRGGSSSTEEDGWRRHLRDAIEVGNGAAVRNLTSASAALEYFQHDGGYSLAAGGDSADIRAKQAEHRNGSAWYGRGIAALGLRVGQKVSAKTFENLLQGHVVGTGTRLGRRRDGMYEHRPGFDITFSAPIRVAGGHCCLPGGARVETAGCCGPRRGGTRDAGLDRRDHAGDPGMGSGDR